MEFFSEISAVQNIIYIISAILFITGIKMLGKEDTAVKGNFLSAFAMFIAVAITVVSVIDPLILLIGIALGAIIGSSINIAKADKKLPLTAVSSLPSILMPVINNIDEIM